VYAPHLHVFGPARGCMFSSTVTCVVRWGVFLGDAWSVLRCILSVTRRARGRGSEAVGRAVFCLLCCAHHAACVWAWMLPRGASRPRWERMIDARSASVLCGTTGGDKERGSSFFLGASVAVCEILSETYQHSLYKLCVY